MTKDRMSSSLAKIEEVRSQLSQALLPAACENCYTVGRLLGSGDDHIAILAWKKPEGECRDSPQHLIPRVMKFIRRGSPTVTSEGLAEELHHRWKLSVHPHMLKLGDVFPTPDYLVIGMEYANAKSLEKSLAMQHQSRGTCALPYPLAIFFFQQLVLTMEFCHQNGVHFQGLQPKYVLISRDKQGNPLVKLGAGGFKNANDEVIEDLSTRSAERAWRQNALYAPPEDLERWLHQLSPSTTSQSPSTDSRAKAKRMARHFSHTYIPTFDNLSAAKRQQSVPVLRKKPVVFRQRSRQEHHSYGGIRHPSDTRMHVGASPLSRKSSSSRGSSRSSADRAVRNTQHAQRTAAERDGSHAQRLLRSNSARVAAAAAAAAAAFGSEITLPAANAEHAQRSMEHSTATSAEPGGRQLEPETTVGEDHTANMRRMQSPGHRHTYSPLSSLSSRQHPAARTAHPMGEGNEIDANSDQPDVVVFERPSPFLPPMSEPQAAPMDSHHASRRRNGYSALMPASEGSAAGRMLQPIPSFKEWGSAVQSGDLVDSSAASVWALGCILFEMLYGYHPFQMEPGETLKEWVAKVKSFDIRWPESVPNTDELRRALVTMLAPHHRRASLATVAKLAFFRRDLPEGAFDMTAIANARVSALRHHHVQDVLSRLRTLVHTCSVPRPDPVLQPQSLNGSSGAPLSCGAQSSSLLCASPATSA